MNIRNILFAAVILLLTNAVNGQELSIKVYGACGMCQERIESNAKTVIGVNSASWDEMTNMLTITHSEGLFQENELHQKMAAIGHDTDKIKSPDDIYDNLHGCCKYRKTENTSKENQGVEEFIIDFKDAEEEDTTREDFSSLHLENGIRVKVYGACGMCQERIESNAKEVIGVNTASWNVETMMLTVTVTDGLFEENELHEKMASIGHDTDKMRSPDEVYDNLHGCCKYRVDENSAEENLIVEKFKIDFADKGGEVDITGATVSGMIYEQGASGELEPLVGANVYLAETLEGTSTDEDGYFLFNKPEDIDSELIVISYTGYANDTIDMEGQSVVSVIMKTNFVMDEVEIVHKRKSTEVSFIDPIKVQNIGQKELCKAACCNLSESFETNPSVDAHATDAVTGTKKIAMLGLAGPYVQVTRENMPYIRGLAAVYGFSYTPGTWIESIQLNMGTGSVVNGPESMTGQINVEVKKPELSEKLNLNLYANRAGRLEANLNHSSKINDRWSTAVLLHGNYQDRIQDRNGDNFQDMPDNTQLIAMNRWKYKNDDGNFAQFGIKGTYIDKSSGQILPMEEGQFIGQRWRADVETKRMEGWTKIGKIFKDRPYASIGFQFSASYHDQNALFGERVYDGTQTSVYANLIYQTIIKDTRHTIKFGASYQFDDYDELVGADQYLRNERLGGVFSEYQYTPNDKWTLVLGLRGDYHNQFGAFLTPRLHMKYNPKDNASLRFIMGRGQRTASIFSENIGLFASNRQIVIDGDNPDTPYGLNKETTWNIGANYTQEFMIGGKSTVFGVDYYYTTFTDQVVVDFDINPQEVHFYNLVGSSYSHSVQTQIDTEVFDGFDLRLAYRYNNPRTDFRGGNEIRPLISKQRAFVNVGWDLGKGWVYDVTGNWQDVKRIPYTDQNPEEFRFDTESPSFITVNSQLTKTIRQGFDIYLGAENLLDYRQEDAILSFDNPFNQYFDSSLIWGPVQGRIVYLGLRYKFI